jgi:uncharacterized membrane protein
VARSTNRRCVRWLESQLPELVSSGLLTPDAAQAMQRHYQSSETRSNLGFVLLAAVGSALIGAGIILLVAHNWDDLSRPVRSIIAFLPLILAQLLAIFVLWRRDESQAWRESVAIFDVAAVGTAISLISQTYQIQGSFADFLLVWLLLSIPIVYVFRSTLGAAAYIIGTVVWLLNKGAWSYNRPGEMFFWALLLLVLPYYAVMLRRDRTTHAFKTLSILLVLAVTIGLGVTVDFVKTDLESIAFAGFFTATYLWGMTLEDDEGRSLNVLSVLGAIGLGITAVVLSFDHTWHFRAMLDWSAIGLEGWAGIAIQLLFPVLAILLAGWTYWKRKKIPYSIAAAAMPLVAILAWMIANLAPAMDRSSATQYSRGASILFNAYALVLGIELLARGIRVGSIARTNFGLLIIAALALARFFDSDLSFVTRGVGFIAVGAGFLIANIIFFRKRVPA